MEHNKEEYRKSTIYHFKINSTGFQLFFYKKAFKLPHLVCNKILQKQCFNLMNHVNERCLNVCETWLKWCLTNNLCSVSFTRPLFLHIKVVGGGLMAEFWKIYQQREESDKEIGWAQCCQCLLWILKVFQINVFSYS